MSTPEPGNAGKSSYFRLMPIVIAAALAALGTNIVIQSRSSDTIAARAEEAKTTASAAATAAGFSPEQQSAIEGIVRQYLLNHPETLIEMRDALEERAAKEDADKTKEMVKSYAKELYRNDGDSVVGNPSGDITVVEFFDYNCGYCKRGFGGVAKLLSTDKNVRFVFKELPIIREESEAPARIALAAKRQGKYWEVHQALIQHKGTVNETEALKHAEKLGLDMTKLKADMNSPEVKAELEASKALAKKMGIEGTPHFLVGDKAVNGAPENLADVLEGHISELRKTGCSYC